VRQAIDEGFVEIVHVPSEDNLADVLTMALGRQKFWPLIQPVLFRAIPGQGECQKSDPVDPEFPPDPGPGWTEVIRKGGVYQAKRSKYKPLVLGGPFPTAQPTVGNGSTAQPTVGNSPTVSTARPVGNLLV